MEAFRGFLRREGVRVLEDGVEVRSVGTRDPPHYAVYATRHLEVGEEVAVVPKSACLSAKTAACASLLEQHQLIGGLALNVAVMAERALGDKSRWAAYFGVCPPRGERSLPLYWSQDELAALEGTEIGGDDLLADMREDYDSAVAPLVDEYPAAFPPARCTFDDFVDATSLCASRAFYVDDGDAMVPVADMFNLVTGVNKREHVNVEGASDDEDDEPDYDQTQCGTCEARRASRHGCLSIALVRPAAEGEELFNTFGEQGNAALLHKYGFCELDNAYTIANVSRDLVAGVVGEERLSAAVAAVVSARLACRDEDNEEEDDEVEDEPEYFQVEPDGTVEPELLMVLRHATATDAEREGWDSSPEDLPGAKPTGESRDALRRVLEARAALLPSGATVAAARALAAGDAAQPPAGGGVVGPAAALLVAAHERATLEAALAAAAATASTKRKRASS